MAVGANQKSVCMVYVMVPTKELASSMVSELLKAGLIACANIGESGVESHYFWQGEVKVSSEVQMWLKTREELFEKVCAKLRDLHPYECPAIFKIPVIGGHNEFLDWIIEETKNLRES